MSQLPKPQVVVVLDDEPSRQGVLFSPSRLDLKQRVGAFWVHWNECDDCGFPPGVMPPSSDKGKPLCPPGQALWDESFRLR